MCINTVYNYYKIALNIEKNIAKKWSMAAMVLHIHFTKSLLTKSLSQDITRRSSYNKIPE